MSSLLAPGRGVVLSEAFLQSKFSCIVLLSKSQPPVDVKYICIQKVFWSQPSQKDQAALSLPFLLGLYKVFSMLSAHIEDFIFSVHLHQADTPWHTKMWWAKGVAKYAAGRKLKLSLFYPLSYEIFFICYFCF